MSKTSNQTRDQKHRIDLAMQFDQYREQYKKTLNPNDYPGNLSLVYELDTRVCLITTDDSTYVGELSSFDHFGNVVLAKASLRQFVTEEEHVDTFFGILFFRAEQILMIGRIDPNKEKDLFGQDEVE